MKVIKLTYLIFLLLTILSGCEVINPEEEIPSYIHIDTVTLKEGYTHNITDVWVYVDDQLQGEYELPVTFPLLYSGTHKISIHAGVKLNGIAATRVSYPFYKAYIQNINLNKDSVISLAPEVEYYAGTTFAWVEDFENSVTSIDTTAKSDVPLDRVFDNGNYVGKASFNESGGIFECKSSESFELPRGTGVILELDYKTDIELVVGLFANEYSSSIQEQIITLNKKTTWNKIYINLTEAISNHPGAIDYNIFIGAVKDADNDTVSEIYLDNIKIIY